MSHTDCQLKKALANMLPNSIESMEQCIKGGKTILIWHTSGHHEVRDSELLHLCSLVEKTLNRELYSNKLKSIIQDQHGWVSGAVEARYETCRATWQQRVMALARLKGIEI